jgi:hypothetical protein
MAQVVELLPNKREALNSNPSTTKKKEASLPSKMWELFKSKK